MLALARAGNVEDYPSAQAYAAAAGLAPCRRESGEWRGRTRASKQGDAPLRAGPYMAALAAAPAEAVMAEWAGLGYYSRARNLVACARAVAERGAFPDTEEALRWLPGLGAYTAAAVAAINGPQDIVAKNRELYRARRDVLVESFGRAGWDIPSPKASMFAWAPLPPALRHLGSLEFSKQLLTHAQVAVAPGVGYGENGEGFVRIAMVENEQRLRQAARNVKRYLQSMGVNTPARAGA